MTPSSPLPAQQKQVSTLVFMHVSIHFVYTFVSLHNIIFALEQTDRQTDTQTDRPSTVTLAAHTRAEG